MELKPVVVSPTATGKQAEVISSNSKLDDDIISSLPDDLVCNIISFLPLEEAVKTSILSTRWRNIYKSISTLNLDRDLRVLQNIDVEDFYQSLNFFRICDSFMDLVDRVLMGIWRERVVHKVRIKCEFGGFAKCDRVESWIVSALDNKVRELDLNLNLCGETPLELPIGLFTCNTLEVLRFNFNQTLALPLDFPPPPPRCCPNLKSLHLQVPFLLLEHHHSLETFFSSFTALEELVISRLYAQNPRTRSPYRFNLSHPTLKRLTIEDVNGFDEDHGINIEAPSLVYFKCHQHHKLVLKNLKSLVQVHIDCGPVIEPNLDSPTILLAYYSTVIQIFQGIYNHAQSLHISGNFGAVLLQGRGSSNSRSGTIPKLPKLTCLHLQLFAGWERVLPELLHCFPCLETLHFEVNLTLRFSKRTRVTLPSQILPSSIWSRLKTLAFSSFEVNKYERRMAKYFVNNAQLLEKFTVKFTTNKYISPKWRSKMTKTLLKLPKLSKDCKILVI